MTDKSFSISTEIDLPPCYTITIQSYALPILRGVLKDPDMYGENIVSSECKTRSNNGPQKRLRIAVVAE